MYFFSLPDYGFSEKPKRVAGNKSDINSVLTDGLYFLFAVQVPQWDDIDKGTSSVVDMTPWINLLEPEFYI